MSINLILGQTGTPVRNTPTTSNLNRQHGNNLSSAGTGSSTSSKILESDTQSNLNVLSAYAGSPTSAKLLEIDVRSNSIGIPFLKYFY